MPAFEIALRGGVLSLLLLIAVIVIREAPRLSRMVGGLLALSVAAYVLGSTPALVPHGLPQLILRFIGRGTPAVFWLWTGTLFDDTYELRRRHLTAWAALPLLCLPAVRAGLPYDDLLCEGLALLFAGLGAARALKGRADDLVEGRRRLRLVLAVAVGIDMIAVTIVEYVHRGDMVGGRFDNSLGLTVLAFAFALASLRGRRDLSFSRVEDMPPSSTEAGRTIETAADDAEAAVLLARLRHLMDSDKAYREEGMSIAALAARLDVPEYRLRRLINQRLGHRNFSSFMNGYRLAEAAAALADPHQREVPVLTIALDAGFQSIGPFNRAFKAEYGKTPTEYRRGNGA